jgi:hypothetical protein
MIVNADIVLIDSMHEDSGYPVEVGRRPLEGAVIGRIGRHGKNPAAVPARRDGANLFRAAKPWLALRAKLYNILASAC